MVHHAELTRQLTDGFGTEEYHSVHVSFEVPLHSCQARCVLAEAFNNDCYCALTRGCNGISRW